jgi:7-carboxy-7-deazaguanine synthase
MKLPMNDIFYSIQGEGSQTGRPVVFIRFSGCNLKCKFCDTDHSRVSLMEPEEVVAEVKRIARSCVSVVITGGEPLLPRSLPAFVKLTGLLRYAGYWTGIETNGCYPLPRNAIVSHISMSPKTPMSSINLKRCDDLKILFPYLPGCLAGKYFRFASSNFYIQPLSGQIEPALQEVLALGAPWKLGVQLHKLIGVL